MSHIILCPLAFLAVNQCYLSCFSFVLAAVRNRSRTVLVETCMDIYTITLEIDTYVKNRLKHRLLRGSLTAAALVGINNNFQKQDLANAKTPLHCILQLNDTENGRGFTYDLIYKQMI